MEYYSTIKKNEILPFATMWMELECIMLSKISQRKIPYDFIHMWNLRNRTDEHMGRGEGKKGGDHKSFLMIENKLRVVGGRWVGDGLDG